MITFISSPIKEKYKKSIKMWIRDMLRTSEKDKQVQCGCEDEDYAFLEVIMEDEFKDFIVNIFVGERNSLKEDYLRKNGLTRRALIFDGGSSAEINKVFKDADEIWCAWDGSKSGKVWNIIKGNNNVTYWDRHYEP